ncbi:hypothetical protein J6590_073599 [Homalodisca vitripennis]|nr:hypothetical protein J6590_073599 [Homalodisca vitripennis]
MIQISLLCAEDVPDEVRQTGPVFPTFQYHFVDRVYRKSTSCARCLVGGPFSTRTAEGSMFLVVGYARAIDVVRLRGFAHTKQRQISKAARREYLPSSPILNVRGMASSIRHMSLNLLSGAAIDKANNSKAFISNN